MCMYTSTAHTLIAKVSSRCSHSRPAAMLVPLRGTPTWRLQTELYKFEWNFSANNSRTVYRTDLRLVEIVFFVNLL